jgi:hypothetical protein
MPFNPKYYHLQNRPYIYGGPYSKNEINKFIKKAAKKGKEKVVDFSNGGKKYNVKKEMKRITGKNNFTLTKNNSERNKNKKSKKPKSKKSKSKKPKKLLSLSARRSLKRRSVYSL